MSNIFGDLRVEDFLDHYWQKRPLLVRGAFGDEFQTFDENDLAGLACEEFAEARLVQGGLPGQNWQLEHGPFAEQRFAQLPESGWTLLVQDVEKHYPPLQAFIAQFDFLPTWRLDDLMISYAAPGGTVGPHVDQYDVFLVQASGRKRWQVSESFSAERQADCPLDVLDNFTPEQEWELQAGDMLYLPPNIAHHGVAIDAGMTWSIGLRAPSAADLYAAFSEHLAGLGDGCPRYTDPPLTTGLRPGEINRDSIGQAQNLLRNLLENEQDFSHFMASFMSRFGLTQEPANPGPGLSWKVISKRIDDGEVLVRNPWTRMTWTEWGGRAQLFATGQQFVCSIALAQQLCSLKQPELDMRTLRAADQQSLCALVSAGHLVFSEA